jgi:hypothetical protein
MKRLYKLICFFALFYLPYYSYSQITAITRSGGIGKLWMQFGYNRAYFLPSDIRFKGPGYNFTVSQAKANDDFQLGSDWGKAIPQFTYRLGYFFNSEEMYGLELSYDWVNYLLPINGKVNVQGTINDTLYNGDKYLTGDFLHYSHINGSGYAELKLVKGFLIYGNHNYDHMFFALGRIGGGVAITRTNATLFGKQMQNNYNLSGFTGTVESSVKYTYKSHWNIETGLKGDFVDYTHVPTVGKGTASQYFIALHWIIAIGFEVRL